MEYKDLIKNAKANGVASEKAMWQSVDNLNDVLCVIKEEHPEMYMAFMRKQHESLYGPHYDRHFADADVEKIRYTNASGEKKSGAHWNMDQILDATKSMPFPQGTTPWDKYVAFNSFYAAFRFYFADEDAPVGKVWEYMTAMNYED